ncbi:MAG: hypothetical protein BYD32DRAFT_357539, partial [Podila humilis]
FLQKSDFIDDAGFNLYQQHLYGWCPKGGKKGQTNAILKLKSVNFSVIGVIYWSGVINMVLQTLPAEPAPNKKRKVTGKNKAKDDHEHEQKQTQGTNANHFLMYIGHVMDALDKY